MDNKKFKKDKEIILDLENQIKEVRHQLAEQLRCLDTRTEHHAAMTMELIDFYQRRAEVEYEYARGLDRISKQIMARHKAEKQKREQWPSYSMYTVWQTMVNVTTKQGRDRTKIGDIFSNIVATKLNQVKEDLYRVHKKTHEVGQNLHEELMKAVADLHSFMKTYHLYNMESEQQRLKLQRVESQKSKVEQKVKKPETSKQFQSISKKTEKHRKQSAESDLKATRSRNEYLLALNSANAALRKFYVDDMPNLINASNYGFHLSLSQVILVDLDSQKVLNRHENASIGMVEESSKQINLSTDLQSFLQIYQQAFSLPRKLNFQPHRTDTICDVQCPPSLHEDMASRVKMITERLHQLKLENDELWKTLETMDGELVKKLSEKDFDASESYDQQDKPQLKRMPSEVEKQHSEIVGAQDFYFNKFKSMQLNSNMIARLSSKCVAIERAMKTQTTNIDHRVTLSVKTARRHVLGNLGHVSHTPKKKKVPTATLR